LQKGISSGPSCCITDEINGFGQFVPTLKKPQILRSFETASEAIDVYETALRIFDDFGWSILFNGHPNDALSS
jgi:hypothetical protein